MKIAGFLLTVAGAICGVIGFVKMDSWEYQLMAELGVADSRVAILLYGGIAMLAAGIILLLVTFLKGRPVEPLGPYVGQEGVVSPGAPAGETLGYGPSLVCVKGPLAGKSYEIGSGGLMLGRDTVTCQVVLPLSQGKVSRLHCLVTYNPVSRVFILWDRKSTHGTYLMNGTKVPPENPVALKRGERFYVADRGNVFEVR